jgi:hypothetical protein
MKHLAIIQSEFVKEARQWDDLTFDEQKLYLKKHPGSKRRITAKPGKKTSLETMTGVKRVFRRLKRLENIANKYENDGVTRQKVYWVLEKAVHGKKPTKDPKTYNLLGYSEDKNKLIAGKLDRGVTRLTQAIYKLEDRVPGGQDAAMKYVKTHFLVERKVKPAKRIEELRKSSPKPVKVKKVKKPEWVSTGDRVQLSNGVIITVTGVKHGHKWVTVNGTTDEGAHWHSKQRSSTYSDSNLKFLGKTDTKDAETKRKQRMDFERTMGTEKLKRKKSNRERLTELNANVGDTIRIRGTHYPWTAEVVSVDWKAGGIRINQIRKRRQRGNYFAGLPGNITEHHRLIPANSILEVVK